MIGVVILSFNDANFASECAYSVKAHSLEKHELIIVNNGCDKKNTEILRSIPGPGKYIELNKNAGVSIGYNLGIKEAIESGCDYVVLLNADTIVATWGWMRNMKEAFQKNPDAGMVAAMTNYIASRNQSIQQFKNRLPYKLVEAPWLGLGLTMFKTEILKEVGFLDEHMGYGGCVDLEISIRLRKAGYKLYADGYTMIWHRPGSVGFKNLKIPYSDLQKKNSDYIRKKYPEEHKWVPLV